MRAALIALAATSLIPAVAGAQTKIVIDPGHGDQDPGGTGNGLQEKNIVLDVALQLRDLLEADSADTSGGGTWAVSLTRTDDTFVSLAGRAAFANNRGADRFISIHSNAFGDPSANGTETFSYAEGTTGAALRNLIQEEMISAWGLRNRGNKTANFAVLRETAMPAALHELAFITNATDAAKLASAEERRRAAEAHLFALQRHYQLAPHRPGAAPDVGSLAGRLVDADGPVAGALVIANGELEATSGDDGRFSFSALPPGSHALAIESPRHRPATAEVEVAAGRAAEIEIELVPLGADGGEGDGSEYADLEGGCRAAGAGDGAPLGSALLVLAALAARMRRRWLA